MLAMRRFHELNPTVPIHLYGDDSVHPEFPAVNHGLVGPATLADIYNRCSAGLVLSFTNLSLAPDEMLACGTIPVVNDDELARDSLSSSFVRWSEPTPEALAKQLGEVAYAADVPYDAVRASVPSRGWTSAAQSFIEAIEAPFQIV